MIALNSYQSVYCVGIGGIGLSAIARYFNAQGKQVFGYDRSASALTNQLQTEGIKIFTDLETSHLNQFNKNQTLVVYTAAMAESNQILAYFKQHDFHCYKRAKILGEITRGKPCIAVAGTHGKTTTSALLAYMLFKADIKFTGFLGGHVNDFNSNYISTGTKLFVVEADEFDRSFLELRPSSACVIAQDPDHLDIYETSKAFDETFQAFVNLVTDPSKVFLGPEVNLNGKKLSVETTANFSIASISVENQSFQFDFTLDDIQLKALKSNLPGQHNIINSALALALALQVDASKAAYFRTALSSFKGIKRRFNKVIDSENLVLIDDYAHHPTELQAIYHTLNQLYPEDKKLVVFQPHLFSRTRDFQTDFIQVLGCFDQVCLLDIYPAREEPIPGINALGLAKSIGEKAVVIEKEEIFKYIKQSNCKIVAMLGAGDIGIEVQKIVNKIEANV